MAENPGLLNNEEFEKVDHDQYTQDENITSTSMTGEMAEEDRYQGDGEGDLLGDEYTSTTVQGSAYQGQPEPLISFESSPPPVLMEPAPETTVMEPSAPPPPTSMKSVSETDATESAGGAWLENVDPRDEVISGSAIDADKSPDVMASPENLPDSTSEPNASCGAEPEFDGEIREVNDPESGSESDSSMSLDGSGDSSDSDNEITDSDSKSELSASEMDEKGAVSKQIGEVVDDVPVISGRHEEDLAVDENKNNDEIGFAYGADVLNLHRNLQVEEDELNLHRNLQVEEDELNLHRNLQVEEAASKEEGYANVGAISLQKDANNYLDEAIAQNLDSNLLACQEDNQNELYKYPVEIENPSHQENYTELENDNFNDYLCSDGKNSFPYWQDSDIGNAGCSEPLEKQLEASCNKEERRSLSDSNDYFSPVATSGEKTDSLHEESGYLCSTDAGFDDSIDSDTMERRFKSGILKNELHVSEDMSGSDNNSDVDRASIHSEEHHVHFKDEVVIMEFSDEEKEEAKVDIEDGLKDSTISDKHVVESDSVENMENKENSCLETIDPGAEAGASEVDFSFYKIAKEEENDSTESLKLKSEPDRLGIYCELEESHLAKSAVTAEGNEAFDEVHDSVPDHIEKSENDNLSEDGMEVGDSGMAGDESHSASSHSDSEGNSSEEEIDDSDSDSSGEGNISGEWNLSPLCDIDKADIIPELNNEAPEEYIDSNISLVSNTPIENTDAERAVAQDESKKLDTETPLLIKDEFKRSPNESQPDDEQIAKAIGHGDHEVDTICQDDGEESSGVAEMKAENDQEEMSPESNDVLDIESQLKEVEQHLISRLISETEANSANEVATDELENEALQDLVKSDAFESEKLRNECKEFEKQDDSETEKHVLIDSQTATIPIDFNKESESRSEGNVETPELDKGVSDKPEDSDKGFFDKQEILPQSELTDAEKPVVIDQTFAEDALNHNILQGAPLEIKNSSEYLADKDEQNLLEGVNFGSKSFKILSLEGQDVRSEPGVIGMDATESLKDGVEKNTKPEIISEPASDLKNYNLDKQNESSVDITNQFTNKQLVSEPDRSVSGPEEMISNNDLLLNRARNVPESGLEESPPEEAVTESLQMEPEVSTGVGDSGICSEGTLTTDDNDFSEETPSEAHKKSTMIIEHIKQVVELIYWRDVKKTGIVFGSMMFILISLACCTVMSVLAYLSLCVLTVTVTFRVYKSIMQAVQKTNEGHPFKKLMELKIELKDEVVQDAAENIAKHLNNCTRELRRLYLVEDYVDSLKFGMLLWLLTYVGSWFSGMTLIILVVVSIFTLPRVYETYKVQIDTYINMARAQLNKIMAQISAKIPFPKKKAKTQ